MQFGMPTLIENHTLEENAALCEALGLRFIELNMNFPEYQVDRLEQTDELVRIAEQHHLYYTVHLDENLNIADFNPLVTKAYLETVRRTILAAKALLPLRDRFVSLYTAWEAFTGHRVVDYETLINRGVGALLVGGEAHGGHLVLVVGCGPHVCEVLPGGQGGDVVLGVVGIAGALIHEVEDDGLGLGHAEALPLFSDLDPKLVHRSTSLIRFDAFMIASVLPQGKNTAGAKCNTAVYILREKPMW